MEIPLCKCGCGKPVTYSKSKKQYNTYYKNHNSCYRSSRQKELNVKEGYKWCSQCKKVKNIEDFPPRKQARDKHDYRCEDCHRKSYQIWAAKNVKYRQQYSKAYYIINKTQENNRSKANRLKHKKEWLKIIISKGLNKCSKCGFDKHFCAIDFHHQNPKEKEFKIAQIIDTKPTPNKIAELDKCIPLCANCHRILHHGRWGM